MTPSQLIAALNALTFGDLDGLDRKLEAARAACAEMGQAALADCLDDARTALRSGDLKTYRKRIETAVSRLGHLRA